MNFYELESAAERKFWNSKYGDSNANKTAAGKNKANHCLTLPGLGYFML